MGLGERYEALSMYETPEGSGEAMSRVEDQPTPTKSAWTESGVEEPLGAVGVQ